MPPRDVVEAHPRSAAAILDDAWRLYFADLPLLLSLSALFFLPAIACLVALVGLPDDGSVWIRWTLPLLASLLLPLTGLSVGACHEVFHSWAETYPVQFGECLKAALRRGVQHVAGQTLALVLPAMLLVGWAAPEVPAKLRVPVVGICLIAWIPAGMFSICQQPSFTAGQVRFWRAFKHAVRATAQHPGSAFLIVLLRGVLLVFAVLNLHLFLKFGLWAAESLGGFDVALINVLCSLDNAAYFLSLVLVAAWLLLPWKEAVNYLFFVDARTRYEGLDLWQRVDELFPLKKHSKAGAIFLALTAGLLGAGSAWGEEPVPAIRAARQEIAAIRKEVQATNPYTGGQRWVPRLQAVGERLEQSEKKPGGYRWFQEAAASFNKLDQPRALEALDDLDTRLALLEDSWMRQAAVAGPSKGDIKALVPPDKNADNKKKQATGEKQAKKKEPPPPKDDEVPQGGGGMGGAPVGPGMVGGVGLGGLAFPLLIVLVGLALAALLVGIGYAIYKIWSERKPAAARQQGPLGPAVDEHLHDPDKQNPAELWQQADELARRGDFLGAVRTLYLSVLALLHQGGFIRYERTRTNGEYADQLRKLAALHRPFVGFTGLFELKWYGERTCEREDYQTCRDYAGAIRSVRRGDGEAAA